MTHIKFAFGAIPEKKMTMAMKTRFLLVGILEHSNRTFYFGLRHHSLPFRGYVTVRLTATGLGRLRCSPTLLGAAPVARRVRLAPLALLAPLCRHNPSGDTSNEVMR